MSKHQKMPPCLQEIFYALAKKQDNDQEINPVCPRCGEPWMRPVRAENAKSYYADVAICSVCGVDEAGRNIAKKQMPLYQWHAARLMLVGKTFHDLLKSGEELDCDLIIGDSDMPATLVWDGGNQFTPEGVKYYKTILDAPYNRLENGNIEVFCDDYELGEHFTLAAAGYIGQSEYRKLFVETEEDGAVENGADSIDLDCGVFVVPGALRTVVTYWEHGPTIEVPEPDDEDILMNYIGSYEIADGRIRYFHLIINTNTCEETEQELPLTSEQSTRLRSAMEKYCEQEYDCSLREHWDQRENDRL